MPAVHTGTPAERETHLTFETAAEHATACVPLAGRLQRVSDIRALLVGQRYESASHIVVCEAEIFLGMMTIEQLLAAAAGATMETLMEGKRIIILKSQREVERFINDINAS